MFLSQRILAFHRQLRPDWQLPPGVELLFPYESAETWRVMTAFYETYYNDSRTRIGLFGINPGRFGAGVTGVPFTDPVRLEQALGIHNNFPGKAELSSVFVYEVVNAWGGPRAFFGDFYITSLSPLGFLKDGINYNYYDDPKLRAAVEPYIVRNLREQIRLGLSDRVAICLGQGQNFTFFEKLNQTQGFFREILPVPHPRWVMQYRRKRVGEYVELYLDTLRRAREAASE